MVILSTLYIEIHSCPPSQVEGYWQYSVRQEGHGWLHDIAVSALPDWRLPGYSYHAAQQSPTPCPHEALLNLHTHKHTYRHAYINQHASAWSFFLFFFNSLHRLGWFLPHFFKMFRVIKLSFSTKLLPFSVSSTVRRCHGSYICGCLSAGSCIYIM